MSANLIPILWTMGLTLYGTKTWRDVAVKAIGGGINLLAELGAKGDRMALVLWPLVTQ